MDQVLLGYLCRSLFYVVTIRIKCVTYKKNYVFCGHEMHYMCHVEIAVEKEIKFQRSLYYVDEDDGIAVICAEVVDQNPLSEVISVNYSNVGESNTDSGIQLHRLRTYMFR